MNLGDGLLFELENGKPRLILLRHGAEKNPVKSCRFRAADMLSCVEEVQAEEHPARPPAARNKEARSRAAGASNTFSTNATGRSSVLTSANTQEAGGGAKAAPKAKSDRSKHSATIGSLGANGRAGRAQSSRTGASGRTGLKDLLTSGNAGLKDSVVCLTNEQLKQILTAVQTSSQAQKPPEEHKRLGQTDSNCCSSVKEGGGGGGGGTGTPEGPQERENRSPGCLFSWMEERRSESQAATEAKKAQWRRELDEQVALKQLSSAPGRPQAEEDTLSVVSVQSSISHREQPAAIRSSLRFGEVSPMEEALSAKRKEEERSLWLEELNKQREETIRRRRQEKLLQSQTEDHELWATHFDSLHMKSPHLVPPPPPLPPPAEAPAAGSDRSELATSSSLSLVWENMSSCGAESLGRASVDTTTTYPTRASFLRTMTALLDPAQIEERERRRIKQLELQRAIEAQVEERRHQREREEVKRREEEQEEERKVELEREMLHRQYQLDALRERQKEVHQADQLRKGQDVSRALQTSEPLGAGMVTSGQEEEVSMSVSSCRDTAVQTESAPSLVHRENAVHNPAPNGKNRAERTGKENICGPGGGGAGGGAAGGRGGAGDPYEGFARTDRSRRDRRRPEWNTQRPSRRFVPASERYPAGLQKHRQESRLRRQAELLALQDRNCPSRSDLPPPPPLPQQEPDLCSDPTEIRVSPTMKVESLSRGQSHWTAANTDSRGRSPPVPAVKHRLQRRSSSSSSSSPPPLHPAALEFIPYVRTDEVFNLDPLEPAATPPPHTHTDAPLRRPSSPPLLRPELTRSTHTHTHTQRQQEILRGLAQLRQGLLQKQRELETDLNPLLKGHGNAHRHMTSDL